MNPTDPAQHDSTSVETLNTSPHDDAPADVPPINPPDAAGPSPGSPAPTGPVEPVITPPSPGIPGRIAVHEVAPPARVVPQGPIPAALAGDPLLARVASIVVLALVAVAATLHGWRPDRVLAPTDALKLVAPWETPGKPYIAANEQLLDQTSQFVPWNIYTVQRFRDRQIPLWNPYSQLGAPFLANGQSAIFYPTILLHLNFPETWSWTLSAALRLFIAGLGMWLLVGLYGQRGSPRLMSAIAFQLCGFAIVWLNHPQMNVMPLLPWAILVVECLLQRVTLARVALGTIVFAIQFFGGHPATSIHLLVTCGLVVFGRMVWPLHRDTATSPTASAGASEKTASVPSEPQPCCAGARWMMGVLGIVLVMAFGFALAAAQWLPMIEYANHSGAKVVREDGLAATGPIALDPRYLVGLVFPYANGYPPDRVTPFEMRLATHLPNTNELAAGFVGTIPLVLALFGLGTLRRRRTVLLWSIIGLIGAAIAIKLPLVDHVVRRIPALNLAQNARMLGISAFALAILAGFGLEALLGARRGGQEFPRLRKWTMRLSAALAAIAILGVVGLLVLKTSIINKGYARAEEAYKAQSLHEHSLEHVKDLVVRVHQELLLTSARLLIPAAMLALIALLLRSARRAQEPGATAAGARRPGPGASPYPWLALALVDLLAFAIPFNPGSPARTYFPHDAPAIAKMLELPAHRFSATHRTFLPETSTAYGLSDLRGYDAMGPERYYNWWAHPGIGNLPDRMQGYLCRMDNPDNRAWSLLNFGYLMTALDQPGPSPERWKLVSTHEDALIYQANEILPRARIVPKVEVLDSEEKVLDRVAKFDFDPKQVVLIDANLPENAPERQTGDVGSARVEWLGPRPPDRERPEVIRLRITGATGGWLVLADSFVPGWTASVISEGANFGRQVPIYPAYGAVRAIPLPRDLDAGSGRPGRGPRPGGGGLGGGGALIVELTYQPWSWRIGSMVSLMSLGLLVVLIGAVIARPSSWMPANRA